MPRGIAETHEAPVIEHKLTAVKEDQARRDAETARFVYNQFDPQAPGAARPHPELAGLRLRLPQQPAIYLVDPEGFRHWIPDPYTYNRIFRDWSGIFDDPSLNDIADGGALTHGSSVIRADGTAPVYFISNKTKRWVTSPTVMDKCNFRWPNGGDVVAPAVTDAIADGFAWQVP
jgi:hypothetical protein